MKLRFRHLLSSLFHPASELRLIAANTGWLIADRVVRMGIGLVVGIWVARYLTPGGFGQLSYALSFVSIFSCLANLGLDGLVIRDLVKQPHLRHEILGTAFVIRLVGALATLALSVVSVTLLRDQDPVTRVLVAILATGSLFQALDTIDLWFQSQVLSRYTIMAKGLGALLAAGTKVLLIILEAPVAAFAWASLMETCIGAAGLLIVYRMTGQCATAWRVSMTRAVALLREGWPLLVSGAVVTIYLRVDQVILGQSESIRQVGIYAAAICVTELWHTIPIAIAASVYPTLVTTRQQGPAQLNHLTQTLHILMVWLSLAFAISVCLFATPLITLLYGPTYAEGAAVLSIHCWMSLFVSAGLIGNHWYILNGLNRFTLYRQLIAVCTNVTLNLMLIPRYGIKGAAIAALSTQLVSSYLFDVLHPLSRPLFWIKTRSFFLLLPITSRHILALLRRHEETET